jgi:hypothetical protein
MGDEQHKGVPQRWLEVTGSEGQDKTIYCPRRAHDMSLHQCLSCPRYGSLAIDPTGKHVYIDCDWEGPGEPPPLPDE